MSVRSRSKRVTRKSPPSTGLALLAFATVTFLGHAAEAQEEQIHIGAQFGYASATFIDQAPDGLGGGLYFSYGITDAVNLRLQLDVTRFTRLDGRYALVWNLSGGATYVIDILDWVPYVGAMAGVVDTLIENEPHNLLPAVEVPFGLGYRLLDNLTIGIEGRYRIFLAPNVASPSSNLFAFGNAEFVWDM